MDRGTGKTVELVKYTPRRNAKFDILFDKLYPKSCGNIASCLPISEAPTLPLQRENDSLCEPVPFGLNARYDTSFERVQFKVATQNNGRRRSAAQQYYHLVVGLYADIRPEGSPVAHWVKVAHKVSEPIIVRGRSPGHYNGTSASSSKRQSPPSDSGSGPSRSRGPYDRTSNTPQSYSYQSDGGDPGSDGSYYMGVQQYSSESYPQGSYAPLRSYFSEQGGHGMTKAEADHYNKPQRYQYIPLTQLYPSQLARDDRDNSAALYHHCPQPLHSPLYEIKDEYGSGEPTPIQSPKYSYSYTTHPHLESPQDMYSTSYAPSDTSSYAYDTGYDAELSPLAYTYPPPRPERMEHYTWAPSPLEQVEPLLPPQPAACFVTPRHLPPFTGNCGRYEPVDTSCGHYPAFGAPGY